MRVKRAALTQHDAQELEWFFSRGQTAFERSNFGGMLERAELYSVAAQNQASLQDICDDDGNVIARVRHVTARPTAELREMAGYVPDNETLQRYAHISAMLKQVEHASPLLAKVLELLFGDHGQRWAPSEPFGRLGALFHVTAKGRQMLCEARKAPHAIDISDTRRMEVLATVHSVQPNAERAQSFAYCLQQAKTLEERALALWNSIKHR